VWLIDLPDGRLALRWRISGNSTYGDAAARVLNAWASNLTQISGNNDHYLLAGLQGYQFANAAEILRDYEGFTSVNLTATQNMMLNVFYPVNLDWLTTHGNGPALYAVSKQLSAAHS
jgi:hypothetical protein